jgi:hypothetical protein
MRLLTPRRAAAAALAAGALALAGCGGGASDAGSAGVPEGASLVPASAPVFVTANTDFSSPEWEAAQALVTRFPSGEQAIQSLLDRIEQDGVSFEKDVKPALGPEVDLALLDLPADGSDPAAVLLTKPQDPGKLEQLLSQGDSKPVWTTREGWYLVAESQAVLDRAAQGDRLADDERFADALGRLDGNPLARVYVNGPAVVRAIGQAAAQQSPGLDLGALGVGSLESVAVGLSAEAEGVHLQAVAASKDGPEPATFEDDLASVAPADALAYVAWGSLETPLRRVLDTVGTQVPNFDQTLSQVELALGVSLENDLLPLLGGHGALWVRPGAPVEVTVVLAPEDPQKGLATLDKLTGGIGALAGLAGGEAPFTTGTESIAGVTAKKLVFRATTVYYALVRDRIVLTNAVKGIADVATGAGGLAGDPAFRAAADAAGLPSKTAGTVYVNLKRVLSALKTAGALDRVSPSDQAVLDNLDALDSLVLYVTGENGETRVEGFLRIP